MGNPLLYIPLSLVVIPVPERHKRRRRDGRLREAPPAARALREGEPRRGVGGLGERGLRQADQPAGHRVLQLLRRQSGLGDQHRHSCGLLVTKITNC